MNLAYASLFPAIILHEFIWLGHDLMISFFEKILIIIFEVLKLTKHVYLNSKFTESLKTNFANTHM